MTTTGRRPSRSSPSPSRRTRRPRRVRPGLHRVSLPRCRPPTRRTRSSRPQLRSLPRPHRVSLAPQLLRRRRRRRRATRRRPRGDPERLPRRVRPGQSLCRLEPVPRGRLRATARRCGRLRHRRGPAHRTCACSRAAAARAIAPRHRSRDPRCRASRARTSTSTRTTISRSARTAARRWCGGSRSASSCSPPGSRGWSCPRSSARATPCRTRPPRRPRRRRLRYRRSSIRRRPRRRATPPRRRRRRPRSHVEATIDVDRPRPRPGAPGSHEEKPTDGSVELPTPGTIRTATARALKSRAPAESRTAIAHARACRGGPLLLALRVRTANHRPALHRCCASMPRRSRRRPAARDV